MKPKKNFIKKWLSAHHQEMINCPYQPGNLKLLKQGCLQRLETAMKCDVENLFKNDLFYYTFRQGLLVCQSCPVNETMNGVNPTAQLRPLKLKNA